MITLQGFDVTFECKGRSELKIRLYFMYQILMLIDLYLLYCSSTHLIFGEMTGLSSVIYYWRE